jgi:hypothetical protein
MPLKSLFLPTGWWFRFLTSRSEWLWIPVVLTAREIRFRDKKILDPEAGSFIS